MIWDAPAGCWQSSIPRFGPSFGRQVLTVVFGRGNSCGHSLRQTDLVCLEERIAWIIAHPHPNLKALVVVSFQDIATRSRLNRDFKTELGDGVLQHLICESGQSDSQTLLQLLASAGSDWVVVSSPALWSDLAGLQLQLRRLAANPQVRLVAGTPVLHRRDDCFSADGLKALLEEWAGG